MPREGGASSTLRPRGLHGRHGVLDHPLSRMMTVVAR